MKLRLFLLIFCFLSGILFFLIKENWLIIDFMPWNKSEASEKIIQNKSVGFSKKVFLYYWQNEQFIKEEKDLVFSSSKTENIKHLINVWFSWLIEEKILDGRFLLESVALDRFEQTAYLSFNQNFLNSDWSTFKKWYTIESLFKTIRQVDFGIKFLVFLVHHKPMEDDHLDFSQAYPLDGFINES